MTNTKATKRALLASVMALLLCFTMLLGTTYAWFTDSVTSSGNKIKAGTLDVQLWMYTGTDAASDGMVAGYEDISADTAPIFGDENSIAATATNANTLWEPGKTQVAYLAIKNGGTLDLKYTVGLNVEDAGKALYEVMEYAIVPDAQYDSVTSWTGGDSVVVGTQSVSGDVELKVGETHYFALAIHMNEDAGSEYMDGQVNFDLTVLATQLNSESDAFSSDYDKDATYPVVDAAQLDEVLASGGDAVLAEDLTFSAKDTTANSGYGATGVSVKGGTFDGNGNTLTVNNANSTWDSAIHTTGGTIKNVTIGGAMRGIFMGSATADVFIDNVSFDTIYTFNSDGGSKEYGVYISNSTMNGWTSYSNVHKEVVFTDCVFTEGNGYAFLRAYNSTEFKNCRFDADADFEVQIKEGAIATFENCYYGDTLITAENIATLDLLYNTDASLVSVK